MPQTRVVPFPLIRDSECASVCVCAIYIVCVCALVVRSLNRCVWFFGTSFIHNILLSVSDKLYHRCSVVSPLHGTVPACVHVHVHVHVCIWYS